MNLKVTAKRFQFDYVILKDCSERRLKMIKITFRRSSLTNKKFLCK